MQKKKKKSKNLCEVYPGFWSCVRHLCAGGNRSDCVGMCIMFIQCDRQCCVTAAARQCRFGFCGDDYKSWLDDDGDAAARVSEVSPGVGILAWGNHAAVAWAREMSPRFIFYDRAACVLCEICVCYDSKTIHVMLTGLKWKDSKIDFFFIYINSLTLSRRKFEVKHEICICRYRVNL